MSLYNYARPAYLTPFIWQPNAAHSLPSFYWNVITDEQRIKFLCCLIHSLVEYQNSVTTNVNELNDSVKELQELFEKFQESGFDDYYKAQIQAWIDKNLDDIIAERIKMIWFGLTMDGYFCAYIPKSWEGIQFDTGMDYSNQNTYGRLILMTNYSIYVNKQSNS